MNMPLVLLSSLLLVAPFSFAHPGGPGVSSSKVTELTAHRIDRLVSLKKIDASFLKNAAKIEVSVVPNQAPVYYKTKVTQVAPAQGAALQIELSFDDDGKPLAYQVLPGGIAAADMGWPDKDSISLIENSLHYVLDNGNETKIKPYFTGLTSVTLTRTQLNGQVVALGQISSADIAQKLNVYLRLDGTLISAEVVP